MDNVFIERLWRSLKYEEVYLHAYGSLAEAKAGIGAWPVFYNEERQHQSHGDRTPRQVYEAQCLWICGLCRSPTYPQAQPPTQGLIKRVLKVDLGPAQKLTNRLLIELNIGLQP
jgi:hypothetical protein